MIRGGVHVEGIRAREVLLLPQTLKNRRQLVHKLLRYTINENFRNAPVVNVAKAPVFSRLSVDRTNIGSFDRSLTNSSKLFRIYITLFYNSLDIFIDQKLHIRSVKWTDHWNIEEITAMSSTSLEPTSNVGF